MAEESVRPPERSALPSSPLLSNMLISFFCLLGFLDCSFFLLLAAEVVDDDDDGGRGGGLEDLVDALGLFVVGREGVGAERGSVKVRGTWLTTVRLCSPSSPDELLLKREEFCWGAEGRERGEGGVREEQGEE